VFRKSELLEKYTVKILFGWNNEKFKDKYLKKIEKGKRRQVFSEVKPLKKDIFIVYLDFNILF